MPRLARPALVCHDSTPGKRYDSLQKGEQQPLSSSSRLNKRPAAQNPICGLPLLQRKLENERLSQEVMDFLRFTWRDSTCKVYSSYMEKWATFCLEHNYDMYEPDNSIIMDFLFGLIKEGASYSAVNTARCALSAILPSKEGRSVGCNEFICMLMKALGKFNPPKPRYTKF